MKAKLLSGKKGLVPHPEADCLCGGNPCSGILNDCDPMGNTPRY